jgi:hypothetical protein
MELSISFRTPASLAEILRRHFCNISFKIYVIIEGKIALSIEINLQNPNDTVFPNKNIKLWR